MARKGKNKRQQWRRQQQKAKKKENKEKKKQKEYYEAQAKWFRDSIRLCQERFLALCEAGVDIDTPSGVSKEKDDLLEAVDELATIWATREWPSVRAHHLKMMMPGKVLDETLADMVDGMMPGFKGIEMKRLKVGFKTKCFFPLTEDELACIQTGEWGYAKMLKEEGVSMRCNQY